MRAELLRIISNGEEDERWKVLFWIRKIDGDRGQHSTLVVNPHRIEQRIMMGRVMELEQVTISERIR